MAASLASTATPSRGITESPEGLSCLHAWRCCTPWEGNNHSLRSAPTQACRQDNCVRHFKLDDVLVVLLGILVLKCQAEQKTAADQKRSYFSLSRTGQVTTRDLTGC